MTTREEQIMWQIRATNLQLAVLADQRTLGYLPVMRWMVDDAGCTLTASPGAHDDAARRAAVAAWADRWELPVTEVASPDGSYRLTATGEYERVRVMVTAIVYSPANEEG